MKIFFLFSLLYWLIGNPFIALVIMLALLYVIDRRFVGIFPSIGRPIRRMRSISRLRQQLSLSPHDNSVRRELARLLLERKKYTEAHELLNEALPHSEQSAEFWVDYGEAELGLGNLEKGEAYMLKALEINERVRYGQPLLKLASALKSSSPDKAIGYAEQFSSSHSSSSEAYYLLGSVYQSLGRKKEAKHAFTESITVYRSVPKYKRRQDRKWAARSFLKRMTL
ncbi:hypothetical protein DCC85_08425 [Paenibacillus sp. CAA11]|uniref:tetratricopeptide repeat protein n=1 Tax=Paenibacillus sp. CAA11 TaxID=1532905 RepID=UPI000D33F2B3|nr:tetratricopeptide repeat protein [Paenibacillus sp. CAA11]AWB44238.1 hypothetical protein DCC85_08425 [Paenibacillus sp. CAA11]